MGRWFLLILIFCWVSGTKAARMNLPGFRVLVLYENGGHHIAYSRAARLWLDKLAADSSFSIDYINDTKKIDEPFLAEYQLFIQLDYPPFGWTSKAESAFQEYITQGKGGWIGFHHASLLGLFDGYPLWQWYDEFLGGITYQNYIATFATARVLVEDQSHPVMQGIPRSFLVEHEEWYTYNKSPRQQVHILATVDESTYLPDSKIKMGSDHPVIWTNPRCLARNVYIFMGHSPELFKNPAYRRLFTNAIFWAARK